MMFISPYHSLSALWRVTAQSPFVRGKPELHHSDCFPWKTCQGPIAPITRGLLWRCPKGIVNVGSFTCFCGFHDPWVNLDEIKNWHQSFVPDQIIWWDVLRVFLWAFTVVSPRATVWSSHIEHYCFCFLTASKPQLEEPKFCMCGWGTSIFSLADCKCHLYVNFSDCLPPLGMWMPQLPSPVTEAV